MVQHRKVYIGRWYLKKKGKVVHDTWGRSLCSFCFIIRFEKNRKKLYSTELDFAVGSLTSSTHQAITYSVSPQKVVVERGHSSLKIFVYNYFYK